MKNIMITRELRKI